MSVIAHCISTKKKEYSQAIDCCSYYETQPIGRTKHTNESNTMAIVDLTHTITEGMPVYPGTGGPQLGVETTIEHEGFKETLMSLYSHTGTHMDPPSHIIDGGRTLDAFDIEHFTGRALVIDCRHLGKGGKITADLIKDRLDEVDDIDWLLFNTGWDQYWGLPEYFGDYPCLAPDAVELIIQLKPKGIGFDTIGIDPVPDETLTIHHALLETNYIVFVENLTNLDKLRYDEPVMLFALPMKWAGSDGAPIRAVAVC